MKRFASLLATATLAVGLTAEPTSVLFTAAAFTKAQRNSSIPTDAGIFVRLPDDGWVPYGPKIQQVSSAAVDPADASRVFLACGNGIVRSTDGGDSWRLVTGWRESDVTALVIDPTDGQKVYASSGWGLLRSLDGGDSWTSIDDGLSERFSRTIVMDEANPARLLAGTAGGLFVTTDRGDWWHQVKGVPSAHVLRLRRGVDQPNTWLAVTEGQGAWLSTDDGNAWKLTAPEVASANLYACAIDPHDANHLAVGGWGVGVWTSTDGGASWQNRADGLPSPNVLTLTYDPHHPGRVWAASFEEGLVFSDNDGATWQDGGLDGSLTNDLGFLPLTVTPR